MHLIFISRIDRNYCHPLNFLIKEKYISIATVLIISSLAIDNFLYRLLRLDLRSLLFLQYLC